MGTKYCHVCIYTSVQDCLHSHNMATGDLTRGDSYVVRVDLNLKLDFKCTSQCTVRDTVRYDRRS